MINKLSETIIGLMVSVADFCFKCESHGKSNMHQERTLCRTMRVVSRSGVQGGRSSLHILYFYLSI